MAEKITPDARRRDRALKMLGKHYGTLNILIERGGSADGTLDVIKAWKGEATKHGATPADLDKVRENAAT